MSKKAEELLKEYKDLFYDAKLQTESICNVLSSLNVAVKESKEKYLNFLKLLKKMDSLYLDVLEVCHDNNIDTADIDGINIKTDDIRANLFKIVSDIEMSFTMEDYNEQG